MTHWLRNTACACLAGAIALGVFAVCARRDPQAGRPRDQEGEGVHLQPDGPNNWETVQAPKGDGQADPEGKQWGGTTGLAVYGLLAAGENPQDPRLAKAIEWLKTAPMEGHYACGCLGTGLDVPQQRTRRGQARVDARLQEPADRPAVRASNRLLYS